MIEELSLRPSSNAVDSRTRLSSLGYTKERQERLRRTLEDTLVVRFDWDSLDLDNAIVADIEHLVLISVSVETTVLHKPNVATAQLKGPDPRAHMRADGMG